MIARPVTWTADRVARPRRSGGLEVTSLKSIADAVWIASAVGLLLFSARLGTLSASLMPVLVAIFVAMNLRSIAGTAFASLPVLLLPGFCVASTLWSTIPSTTLYYASQYFLTALLGVLLGSSKNRPAVYGMLVAFFIHGMLSVAIGRYVGWGGGGHMLGDEGVAFAGLMNSKNSAADAAGIGVLVALAGLAQGFIDRRPLPVMMALILIPANIWVLKEAHSAGALIAATLGGLAFAVFVIGRIFPAQIRMAVFSLVFLVSVGAGATQAIWLPALINAVADASGKDRTLTGRSYIWSRNDEVTRRHPLVGVGYAAFWQRGNLEAEAIWRNMKVGPQGPFSFNFHNSVREIRAHLGYIGLAIYSIVVLLSVFMLYARATWRPSTYTLFCCGFIAMVAPRLGFESVGFQPVSTGTAVFVRGASIALDQAEQTGSPAPPSLNSRRVPKCTSSQRCACTYGEIVI